MESLLKNLDGICARMNTGLAAVALVLSVLVAAELTVRLPALYQQAIEAEATAALTNSGAAGF